MLNDAEITDLNNDDGVSVHTGFPNPALDKRGSGGSSPRLGLDFNQLLVRHPSATFLFRVAGHHWSDQGVYDGDVAVIDRSRQANSRSLVLVWQDSGFMICQQRHLSRHDQAWGVITSVIHQLEVI